MKTDNIFYKYVCKTSNLKEFQGHKVVQVMSY